MATDTLCIHVEENALHIPVREQWNTRFDGYGALFALNLIMGYIAFLYGSHAPPPRCPGTRHWCMCVHVSSIIL